MKALRIGLFMIVAVVFLLASCVPPAQGYPSNGATTLVYSGESYQWVTIGDGILRLIDTENDVACYARTISSASLECVNLNP